MSLTDQKLSARNSAASLTDFLLSPVTITTAWFLGSSAQAYPVQIAASIIPGLLVIGLTFAYKLFPGSILVLVFSPGSKIGTSILALNLGLPFPFSSLSKRLSTALFFDSIASSCGAIL